MTLGVRRLDQADPTLGRTGSPQNALCGWAIEAVESGGSFRGQVGSRFADEAEMGQETFGLGEIGATGYGMAGAR